MPNPTDTNQPDHIVDMHEMVTDANQASEDDLRAAILTEFKQVHKLAGSGDYTENCTNIVMSLIRTEKLKLLNEVIHQSTVNLKSAKAVAGWAEIRKEQLEAEL